MGYTNKSIGKKVDLSIDRIKQIVGNNIIFDKITQDYENGTSIEKITKINGQNKKAREIV